MAEDQESGGIKELRDAADRGKEAIQERDQLKREMAFLKAGVDTESKAGKLLFKAYDGELETDAIQVEWHELVPPLVAETQPEPEPEVIDATDTQVAEERQALANDGVPPENQSENPYEQGHREFKEMVSAGRPNEDATASFVRTVIEAAARGDERVISDR